jgi:phytanoyl-CoA hydroxylase
MLIENSVKTQARPWFMDDSQIAAKLVTLAPDVLPHVKSIIDNGFAIIRGSIPKQRCDTLIARFKSFASANPDKFKKFLDSDGHYPRIINLHAALPELFELFSKNQLAYRVQEALFDATPCLYTSLFYERGSAQTPHRDTPVFSTRPEYFYFGVWVALEDANLANGALQVYRGGHKIPELDREAIALKRFGSLDEIPPTSNDLWIDYQGAVEQGCKDAGLEVESLCVSAGDTVIWHPQLPHGGGPISDLTKSRFSFVMHTTPVGVPVYHQDKFFNPSGEAPIDAQWWYEKVDNCYRVVHNEVNFAHSEAFPASSFKHPADEPVATAKEEPRKGFLDRILGRT